MKNKLRVCLILIVFIQSIHTTYGQEKINISVYADSARRPVSRYIYGKNNSLSDSPDNPLTTASWQKLRDAGITMFRENGGNNATKYNWRKKLSSHPDWYNNVYSHDWGYAAQRLQQNIPDAQGMWAFQLIGKVAKTTSANFNDWGYNGSQWWEGVTQNIAGGGTINPAGGGKALVEGNTDLYLENWPADSTVAILDGWFSPGGLGLDSTRIRYWNMDNEPEIWDGTHDDVFPLQPSAEEFMQSYFAVAKKARAKYPGIKLLGPVPANEWQWFNWNGDKIAYKGKSYVWLEYFILRVAEEQQATGIRLLDALDIHFYPGETGPAEVVQLHRVYFDRTYDYPGANGAKRLGSSGWDAAITKEYIFGRCSDWLEQYMGINHGVTFSVTETSINNNTPSVVANWYASTLGEFAKQGVGVFTPWDWKTGMYEVVHLFSKYGYGNFVASNSSLEEFVSVYPMANETNDSMAVFLVNRSVNQSKNITVDLRGFQVKNGAYTYYELSQLPQNETFVSHTQNALKTGEVDVVFNKINLTLEPLSVTTIRLNSADEELRNVTFKVSGGSNEKTKVLNQATISIDGDSVYTNVDGEAFVGLTPGIHAVNISKNGYWPVESTVTIVSDTIISATLIGKAFEVNFTIIDKENGETVEGCRVSVAGKVGTSGTGGTAVFDSIPGEFSVTLSKEHYRDTTYEGYQIDGDTTLYLRIEPVKYSVDFKITNIFTGVAIYNAIIVAAGDSIHTDNAGKARTNLRFGNHPISIANKYYETMEDIIAVSNDTILNYSLSPTLADVKFRLKKGTTPVNKASISIGDSTLSTNTLGITTFFGLPTKNSYLFAIAKEGYNSVAGEFYLQKDTTLDINMSLTWLDELLGFDDPALDIWPNPATNIVHVRIKSALSLATLNIYTLSGKKMMLKQIKTNEPVVIDINGLPAGMYIIQSVAGESVISKYFIRN